MTMDMAVSKFSLLWLHPQKSPCCTDGLRDEAWKKRAKMLVAEVMNWVGPGAQSNDMSCGGRVDLLCCPGLDTCSQSGSSFRVGSSLLCSFYRPIKTILMFNT